MITEYHKVYTSAENIEKIRHKQKNVHFLCGEKFLDIHPGNKIKWCVFGHPNIKLITDVECTEAYRNLHRLWLKYHDDYAVLTLAGYNPRDPDKIYAELRAYYEERYPDTWQDERFVVLWLGEVVSG